MRPDRDQLRDWYRHAMTRRADELRALRVGLAEGDPATRDAARAVGQALRGSGATFGFPDLSAEAALVETSGDDALLRRVEGLIEHLNALTTSPSRPGARHAEWLLLAVGAQAQEPSGFPDLASAWAFAAERSGLSQARVVEEAASRLGLAVADLGQVSRGALRLVPEALMRRELLLPVAEDAQRILVASADPTSLATELELTRLTGRELTFALAPPDALERVMRVLVEPGRAPVALKRRAIVAGDSEAERVLVVDDDVSSRLLARSVLEKRGYTVVEAGDGVEALDRLRSGPPVALVVADLNMPAMDGLELIWEMRADSGLRELPVIVLTGETDEILETKLIEEGADDYVCKPIDPRLFLARVGATIRRAEA